MEKIVKVTAYSITHNVQETAKESITVGEMIERLQDFPLDAKVVYQKDSDSIYCYFEYGDSFREL
jgi:hypothetical protein